MNILVHSYVFWPSMGGIERVSEVLCEQFSQMGHQVTLVTQSINQTQTPAHRFNFDIVRQPNVVQLMRLARQHHVLWQNNISLPMLLASRPFIPCVITMQTWLGNRPDASDWKTRLKRQAYRLGHGVAISQAIAVGMPGQTNVIPNPFDGNAFRLPAQTMSITNDHPSNPKLLYVGRLVSDKGVDLLIDALALMPADSRPGLTIVGDGPELERLRKQAAEMLHPDEVTFLGALHGPQLVEQYQRHALIVIPSRWPEPFGVVALEAIASGCVCVAANHGGLPEAVGPCGLLFEPGNVQSLADAIRKALQEPGIQRRCRDLAPSHLDQFTSERVALAYLTLFEEVVGLRC